MTKSRRSPKKTLLLFALLLGVVLLVLELTNTTHLFHHKTPVSKPDIPTSQLPAHPLANGGEKKISSTSSVNQQTATDQNGQKPAGVSSNPATWLTSQSGVITVKLPTTNSTFSSGDQLYGSAKVGQVQYRLIDDQVGVISQGPVSVVNGNFSATVNFKAYAKTGRLDVFTADDNGKESNEVQVSVHF
jgi:hypothetical protein